MATVRASAVSGIKFTIIKRFTTCVHLPATLALSLSKHPSRTEFEFVLVNQVPVPHDVTFRR